jgi:hypothetical protein
MPCIHNSKTKCNTCISRDKRERNPIRYAYDTLRANCIRRKGIGWFELTFEEFKQFAIETKYIAGKGRTKTSYTIDRKDNTMGYFIGNIEIRSNSYNSRKRTKSLRYEWDDNAGKMAAWVTDSNNISHSPGTDHF